MTGGQFLHTAPLSVCKITELNKYSSTSTQKNIINHGNLSSCNEFSSPDENHLRVNKYITNRKEWNILKIHSKSDAWPSGVPP